MLCNLYGNITKERYLSNINDVVLMFQKNFISPTQGYYIYFNVSKCTGSAKATDYATGRIQGSSQGYN